VNLSASRKAEPEPEPSPDLRHVAIFGDESVKRGPFDVLGALWLPRREANELRTRLAGYRKEFTDPHPNAEMKWKKCARDRPKPLYLAAVDDVLGLIQERRACFKCIVVQRGLVRHREWNGGDKGLSVAKAWHLLLRSRTRRGCQYTVTLDAQALYRESSFAELRTVLNHCARKDHGIFCAPYLSVEPLDSKKDDVLQVVDLLTGAVGYHWAEDDREPNASPGKVMLAAHIARQLGRRNLRTPSGRKNSRFNIWRWTPGR
jgi:hypothetical protein